ncbi:hypothetical protein [Pseudomonas sp. Q1-7]|uniref:hypothetical protein n=1 Tax=Pseudomonas sp. Q1-7 TaxID=3020843 RepID=UPI0023004657|nr:hypothetical protein [Pseudomonas sp. Q1-7]
MSLNRRKFLKLGASIGGASLLCAGMSHTAQAGAWHAGDLAHLLPSVNHERIRIKCSFRQPLRSVPQLRVDDRLVLGQRSDSLGRFWRFDVSGCRADHAYELQLLDGKGAPLCDAWPLRTFPAPQARPEALRVLLYTCAGGHPAMPSPDGAKAFLGMPERIRLLEHGLSFQPDVVIANGDHIYWDQKAWLESFNPKVREGAKAFYGHFGLLQRDQPALGSVNEPILTQVCDVQIADLYGVRLRSTPSYFIDDDHDYFENDDADERFVTFPPDHFMLDAGRSMQHLYLPEYLPDASRPEFLPGSLAADRDPGISECFGTLRYGTLFEGLMYGCARFLDLKGEHARLVPEEAEAWLLSRTAALDTRHLAHLPSHPMGWSAGKWREWYPDIVASRGSTQAEGSVQQVRFLATEGDDLELTTRYRKYFWQEGWWAQHQRLLEALSAQPRTALMLSGDLHASGCARIERSGDLDLSTNPVYSVLTGTLATAGPGWPSSGRGLIPSCPSHLNIEELLKPLEHNGFSLLDVTPQGMRVRLFAWDPARPAEAIDGLQPVLEFDLPTQSTG